MSGHDKEGKRFGLLTVIRVERYHVDNKYYSRPSEWRCECDCGRVTTAYTWDLTFGTKTSCGFCALVDMPDREVGAFMSGAGILQMISAGRWSSAYESERAH